ncbi:MAG TPA: aminoglycoside phosphotransferase family protein [Streptosporangiaceae bacterium]|nr:aminoglycoside phosphotransferase family protein [Streptosporangiaceae bacterium]HUZ27572.1 aminoglycoside phosphotransferase family protein [Streptosporangiaceae bacterium]
MTLTGIRTAIEAELGCALTEVVLPGALRHHNTHYRGTLPDRTSLFVKMISDSPGYYTAEVRAAQILSGTTIRTPRLIRHGALDETHRWLAYQWHDFRTFTPTPQQIQDAGELLGRLHAKTRGTTDPQLRRYGDVNALILEKTAQVARLDTGLAGRIRRLHDSITNRAGTDLGQETCLLHGDIGWRNLHTDPGGRAIWMVDFEHAALGHPLLDFAKLWDRELADQTARAEFVTGYRLHHPDFAKVFGAIDAVRLWAAAGIFPYAVPRGDYDFEQHAYRILGKLEERE